ncbi:MAG: hypothetical protein QW667_01350 [Candidatus Bathyarchaeia archaeon]
MHIKDLDFVFENSHVIIIANRNCPEIKLAGLIIGPLEEGNQYEVQYWIAKHLEKAGIARIRDEELLDAAKLYKIQWTERVQTAGQISKLPENFYQKLRRYLVGLKEDVAKSPEKLRDYEKAKHLTLDIVNARLKKIVSLASAPTQTEHLLKNLTDEEKILYKGIRALICKWRAQILKLGEVEE